MGGAHMSLDKGLLEAPLGIVDVETDFEASQMRLASCNVVFLVSQIYFRTFFSLCVYGLGGGGGLNLRYGLFRVSLVELRSLILQLCFLILQWSDS